VSGSNALTISAKTLQSITVTASNSAIVVTMIEQFAATGNTATAAHDYGRCISIIKQLTRLWQTPNHITLAPPDLYGYFSQNWQGQYHATLHPNGLGYQSMANLWNAALP
jgi:hypothetical protein